jgi:GNAT superfamily N-acetyltransferase
MLTFERSDVLEASAVALADLINRAFVVEAWFAEGDRTTPEAVYGLLSSAAGAFFVALDMGSLVGCVYAEQRSATRGYIGLLAVAPGRSGEGTGSRLMKLAEQHLARMGCDAADITVVNLRTELFPFYERRGYRAGGETAPLPRPSTQSCHLVTLTKWLRPNPA